MIIHYWHISFCLSFLGKNVSTMDTSRLTKAIFYLCMWHARSDEFSFALTKLYRAELTAHNITHIMKKVTTHMPYTYAATTFILICNISAYAQKELLNIENRPQLPIACEFPHLILYFCIAYAIFTPIACFGNYHANLTFCISFVPCGCYRFQTNCWFSLRSA